MLEFQGQAPEQDDRGQDKDDPRDCLAAVGQILAGLSPPDTQVGCAGEDPDSVRRTGDWAPVDVPEVDERCGRLAQAVVEWSFLVQMKNAIENQMRAYIRCHKLGWTPPKRKGEDDAESEAGAKKIEREVERIMKAAREGTLDDPSIIGLVLAADQAAEVFRKPADRLMREAERLAMHLPAAGFVNETRGLGLASFAKLIGVTGPLHNYATPAKLWKRLGLGLVDERGDGPVRQGKRTDPRLADLHGYSPSRRSLSWQLYDSMFKNQSPEWRAIYDRKKAEYLARVEAGETRLINGKVYKLTRKWADIAARRYVEKRVVLRLWRAWMQEARSMAAAKASAAADEMHAARHAEWSAAINAVGAPT